MELSPLSSLEDSAPWTSSGVEIAGLIHDWRSRRSRGVCEAVESAWVCLSQDETDGLLCVLLLRASLVRLKLVPIFPRQAATRPTFLAGLSRVSIEHEAKVTTFACMLFLQGCLTEEIKACLHSKLASASDCCFIFICRFVIWICQFAGASEVCAQPLLRATARG